MLNQRPAIVTPLRALVTILLFFAFTALALGYGSQPYMKSARTQLQKARAHLYAGEDDKGGHRARAMAYTTAAIDEVSAALKASHHHHAQAQTGEIVATPTSAGTTFQGSHMRKALVYLKQGQTNLAAATPDQAGHHAKAMDLINKAIEEVEKANAPSPS